MPATHSAERTKREHLSVVLPTYNERDNILPLLKELLALAQPYKLELLVVDDDSSDGTAELVRELAHHDPRVRLIRRLGRYGL
ncbi:MAG: glycosyltransferase, partial [Prochlorococcus sp.]